MTHYHISYSEDAYRWEWARDIYGDKKVGGDNVYVCSDLVSPGTGNLICLFLAKIQQQI